MANSMDQRLFPSHATHLAGTSKHDVAIVGAGPAGVSIALSLRDRGIRPLLIDQADQVGSAWRNRYDRLKLNTGRPFSHLPNRPYPKGTPMFPSRDDVVAHLDRHAREDGIELRLGVEVLRVDRRGRGWCLRTLTGDIEAGQVVIAIGHHHTPHIPHWPGADDFDEIVHSADYRNPGPYQGKKALVVGSGSSALEIAHDLSTGGAAEVWLSFRTPPNVLLRSLPGGLPCDLIAWPLYRIPVRLADAMARAARRMSLGDLSEFGLPVPDEGVFFRAKHFDRAPAIVDKDVIDAIKNGSVTVVASVEAFESDKVVLVDGSRLDAQVVVAATGYESGLRPLVDHLGVLDATGNPLAVGTQPAASGLRFIGYDIQPSFIGHMARQSKRVAKRIASELSAG
jgi:cation diffusion facilitator CzcD-associated flavoprotein CzcO